MNGSICMKIFVSYLAFLVMAFSFGLMGPTLPELQRIAGVDADVISWLGTARGFGQLIGSPLGGVAIEHLPRGWISSISVFLSAPCIAAVPFFSSVVLMGVAYGLWGFISAFAIVGINMEIIRLGGNNNGPLLQALHCIYNVGLLLAPIAVQPFLEDKPTTDDNDDNFKDFFTRVHADNDLEDVLQDHGWSYIVVPYVIGGLMVLVSALIYFCVLCATKTNNQRTEVMPSTPANVPSQMQKNRLLVFVPVSMFFVFNCLIEVNYTTFVATFAVDYLGWSDKSGALLTAVFTLGLTAGRFFGIFIIKILGPTKLIWCSLVIAILGHIPVYFLNYGTLIIWISSGILGLAIGPLYATTLTWTNDTIHLSETLGSILIFAGCVGYTVGPFLQSLLFTHVGILSFIYLISAALACALLMNILFNICVNKKTETVQQVIIPTAPPEYESDETTQLLEKN